MKGSDPMKYRPMTRHERREEDPQEARDLRRQINKELDSYDARELANLLWKMRQRKG